MRGHNTGRTAVSVRLACAVALVIGAPAFVGLSGCNKGGPGAAAAAGEDHPMVGVAAPAFELSTVDGEKHSLAAHAGKVVVVDFWATWCDPCRDSFPIYQTMVDDYQGKVVVLAISEDDESDGIAAFGKETGVAFPLLWDADQSVANGYAPSTMPTSYVVDQNGIVRYVHPGFRSGDAAILREKIDALLE